MLIFLDFDGVLHPYTSEDAVLFVKRPIFHEILRALPDARVVVSSSWKHEGHSLDALRKMICGDATEFSHRVIGTTPMVEIEIGSLPDRYRHSRWQEIRAWRRENDEWETPFICLDDKAVLFPDECPNLYLTQGAWGLMPCDIPRILELATFLRSSHG